MALEKKQKINSSSGGTILALVLLVVMVIGTFMFLLPKREDLKDGNTVLTQKQVELKGLKNKLSQVEALEKSFEGSEVTLMDTLNLIPETTEQGEVIKTFATITDDHEISMNSLSFGLGSSADTDVNVLTVNTNLAGSHKNLLDFLEDLEQSSRKYVVKSLSVQKLQNTLENMTLTVEAYYL